jgi:hypothetical protein
MMRSRELRWGWLCVSVAAAVLIGCAPPGAPATRRPQYAFDRATASGDDTSGDLFARVQGEGTAASESVRATSLFGFGSKTIDTELLTKMIRVRVKRAVGLALRDILTSLGDITRPIEDVALTLAGFVTDLVNGEARSQTLVNALVRNSLAVAIGLAATDDVKLIPRGDCPDDRKMLITAAYEGLAASAYLQRLGFVAARGKVDDPGCVAFAARVAKWTDTAATVGLDATTLLSTLDHGRRALRTCRGAELKPLLPTELRAALEEMARFDDRIEQLDLGALRDVRAAFLRARQELMDLKPGELLGPQWSECVHELGSFATEFDRSLSTLVADATGSAIHFSLADVVANLRSIVLEQVDQLLKRLPESDTLDALKEAKAYWKAIIEADIPFDLIEDLPAFAQDVAACADGSLARHFEVLLHGTECPAGDTGCSACRRAAKQAPRYVEAGVRLYEKLSGTTGAELKARVEELLPAKLAITWPTNACTAVECNAHKAVHDLLWRLAALILPGTPAEWQQQLPTAVAQALGAAKPQWDAVVLAAQTCALTEIDTFADLRRAYSFCVSLKPAVDSFVAALANVNVADLLAALVRAALGKLTACPSCTVEWTTIAALLFETIKSHETHLAKYQKALLTAFRVAGNLKRIEALIRAILRGGPLSRADLIAMAKDARALVGNNLPQDAISTRVITSVLDSVPDVVLEEPSAALGVRVDAPALATRMITEFTESNRPGFYLRATVGTGYLWVDKGADSGNGKVAPIVNEELGVGYRDGNERLYVGANLIASGLLYQIVSPEVAEGTMFLGVGVSVSFYRLIDATVNMGGMIALEDGDMSPAIVVGLQVPLADYVTALVSDPDVSTEGGK